MNSMQGSLFAENDPSADESSDSEVEYVFRTANWLLGLMNQPGIGPNKAISIATKFQNLESLYDANPLELKKLLKGAEIDPSDLIEVDSTPPADVKLVTFFDSNYPAGLRDLASPPPILWYRGNIPKIAGVAIVGTRNPSSRGAALAFEAGRITAEQEMTVVSGLALGIDSSAHKGSLESNGVNVAVLACDVRNPSPKANFGMAEEILEKGGCLVAEVPPGTVTEARNLVARNRIQAAWAKGLIMAECGIPSGTLHTVRFALQINRPIAVFDPKILPSPTSSNEGNLALSNPDGCDPEILGASGSLRTVIQARKPCADNVLESQEATQEFISNLR
jgi:DNA protecting protein DprA